MEDRKVYIFNFKGAAYFFINGFLYFSKNFIFVDLSYHISTGK